MLDRSYFTQIKIVGLRSLVLALFAVLVGPVVNAQAITVQLESEKGDSDGAYMVLWNTIGSIHHKIDSVAGDTKGVFKFTPKEFESGFYQLSVNDTDRVDIILTPKEPVVEIKFSGVPLQEHIQVVTSDENQRLWEYKAISRDTQEKLRDNHKIRASLSYNDTLGLERADSTEAAINDQKQTNLDRLIQQAPNSFFSRMVIADRELMAEIPNGFEAIRDAFNWSDPNILRSAIHDKAVMAALQNTPIDWVDGLAAASDSVLSWSEPNLECWAHTRRILIELFDQYGPDLVTQHLVDSYVVGAKVLVPPESDLLHIVADLMRVIVGAPAPDGVLPDPYTLDTVALAPIFLKNAYTTLFFYSSTCDHCHDQMPGLRDVYLDMNSKGFEVIGIALDPDTLDMKETIIDEQLPWHSYSELLGWGSPLAKAYAVKSTPNYFVIDRKGIIVAKPVDHDELRLFLDENLQK